MRSILVQLPPGERRCTVAAAALESFAREIIDDLLFQAARAVPDDAAAGQVEATLTFTVMLDPVTGDLRINR